MKVSTAIQEFKRNIPSHVKLVAVSKTKPLELIAEAYENSGHTIYGENKVQELVHKYETLAKDIEWHFIGHLQTNKVKYIAPFISLLHGVDSLKLLKVIDKEARKNKRSINCLLQIHIADEETKFGLSQEELIDLLEDDDFLQLKHVQVCGLMGMATNTDDEEKVKEEFAYLKRLFDTVKGKYFKNSTHFNELSMGMSGDYKLAIESGSTMIRIGSSLFGERNYNK